MTVMQIVQQLFGSMGITMEIFFVTLITSLILGLGLALVRMSKNPILSVIAKFYISVMQILHDVPERLSNINAVRSRFKTAGAEHQYCCFIIFPQLQYCFISIQSRHTHIHKNQIMQNIRIFQ